VELGALLWLLCLDEQDPKKQGHFLRLGGGKPLGFGSVKVEIKDTDLRTGTDWQAYYLTLDEISKPDQKTIRDRAVADYRQAVEKVNRNGKSFEQVEFIRAFLAAARGPARGPIHYPRVTSQPDPNGENFKWFSEADGSHPLPLLESEDDPPGLPYFE
jgi:hypothetical protein